MRIQENNKMKTIPFRIKASEEEDNFSDVYAFLVQGSYKKGSDPEKNWDGWNRPINEWGELLRSIQKPIYEVEIDIDNLNDLGITDTRCTCPHFQFRQQECKHIIECQKILEDFGVKTTFINKPSSSVQIANHSHQTKPGSESNPGMALPKSSNVGIGFNPAGDTSLNLKETRWQNAIK